LRDFDELVEQYHSALQDFVKGNPKPLEDLFSNREDVTLANPFGGIARGWKAVKETQERAASFYREGTHTSENVVKYVNAEIAYLVEVERFKAKLGGQTEMSTGSLRVTSIFRKEDGFWKTVHRHADPLTTVQTSYEIK